MIEFKADCGHTVRAKDEDAGKVVRCAYCGREAQVPQDEQDELDFLFSPAEADDSASSAAVKAHGAPSRRRSSGMPFQPSRSRADPFLLVKRMAYVAAILICAIFVGKKYAWPAVERAFLQDEKPAVAPADFAVHRPKKPTIEVQKPRTAGRMGFLLERLDKLGREGVYVRSVPEGATVYHAEAERTPKELKWLVEPNTDRVVSPMSIDLKPGRHVLVVTLPINDRHLKEYRHFGYNELRRKVEEDPERSDDTVDRYFRPDTATDVSVVVLRGRIYIARKYEVSVHRNEWTVLAPLFLPYRCALADLHKLVSREEAYGFSETDILSELEFYGVVDRDHRYIVDILRRVGSISYHTDSGGWRMFMIDSLGGDFTAPKLAHVRRGPWEPLSQP